MYENLFPDPNPFQNTIDMLGKSIMSKERHLQFFQWLIDQIRIDELSPIPSLSSAQTKEVLAILEFIKDEELNHANILYNMYYRLTGTHAPLYEGIFNPPGNLIEGLRNILVETLESVQEYRNIMNGLQYPSDRYLISNIISDELNHVDLLSNMTFYLNNLLT
jgi:hypothetical protein